MLLLWCLNSPFPLREYESVFRKITQNSCKNQFNKILNHFKVQQIQLFQGNSAKKRSIDVYYKLRSEDISMVRQNRQRNKVSFSSNSTKQRWYFKFKILEKHFFDQENGVFCLELREGTHNLVPWGVFPILILKEYLQNLSFYIELRQN
jgi:hypothetical protein